MVQNLSQRATPEAERSLAATSFNGSAQNIGTALVYNPVIMIFDNQTDVAVPLLVNNVLWHTFSAGQSLVLDMRGNKGMAANFTFSIGDQFSTNASVGTSGSFRISTLYAR
jgi:hypothetical protein